MADISKTVQTMSIPLFVGNGKIEYGEEEIPVPGAGQLLLQVKANALCGSDRGQFNGGTSTTPGHEASGIVAVAGPDTNTAVGTPGVVFLMGYCGKCPNCEQGYTNQCLDKRADYGFSHDGGYGPFMLIDENVFFAIDKSIPMTEATMLLDIMGTGGHAIKRASLVRPDIRSVAVTGAGPIGLGVLAMAKLLLGHETPVFITDFVPYRLALAERMGAVPVNLNAGSLADAVAEAGLSGTDIAIDTSGQSEARRSALEVLNKRGVLVCVGHGQDLQVTNVSHDLIATERSVLGSEYFRYDEFEPNHKLMLDHLPYLSQIITHRFKANEIQEAYELFFNGETGKVVVEQ
ncbi:zinc-binding dehydrogenase [Paenibacillus spongiae]|uniref:Alcohol dehydrogenase catalytic domain-containing protein n=1 Tax=Paenibacillus spongiae TaxID=2909671 RepID=A0ABY5SHE1_9BACL|nr:alcohol dehydrogenase catalytic domain-containing protein [Paenibacillus spongiae]UVI33184.1 alcohol dehydrogenase catalytic domain-containing protein [Paenibacillus spongiae]